MSDSQSSIDDMPPTPTKAHDGRRSKENSLRRKTFGRQRTSLGNNTFDTSELHSGTPFNQSGKLTPIQGSPDSAKTPTVISFGAPSPHTPDEPLAMPDTSKLSISGPRRGSLNFNSSLNSNGPPATPTTPRELDFFAAEQAFTAALGLPDNDIDVSLTERFFHVSKLDEFGEFSEVYRVEDPVGGCARPEDRVTVVKKSNKPFTGQFDRRKKMREVEALKAVRGNEHVLRYIEHWEFESNLYIQTEYCEGGTLKKFIEPNFHPDRLDDFRIWKVLLELSMGLQHIHDKGFMHLDLKPENIFIDFEGILKIADFGLAAAWPAPPHLDAEGDRSYLAPETMDGHPDKPSDIFALGVMMIEIGGNYPIPHFGERWYDLRHGRFRLPSLTWSNASSTLSRDSSGEPIARNHGDSLPMSDFDAPLEGERLPLTPEEEEELLRAPFFMVDETHEHALNQVVQAMVNPDPEQRPTAEQIFSCFGCQWVLERRRAGATIYEGNFGPSQENLGVLELDDEVDAMDMS
ncbi:kinase-like protein [Corynespora cassiicola Philippines]|uniref:Kinase-like protein n=1 Tax=Corynespora cassiicola Philippines TaxID=1448308 RepID=A0A2T2N7W3_CORCC|nr:kinase-like protein [Corynespora cassiicola Philippines]